MKSTFSGDTPTFSRFVDLLVAEVGADEFEGSRSGHSRNCGRLSRGSRQMVAWAGKRRQVKQPGSLRT